MPLNMRSFSAPPSSPNLQVDISSSCINTTVNITCSAKVGNPPDTTLIFYQNNQQMREVKNAAGANAAITITLDKQGNNLFTCQATNIVGSSDNSTVKTIDVKGGFIWELMYCYFSPVLNNCFIWCIFGKLY